ncbi:MAG: YdcF family protein [Pseudobdellovibrionaceae bacterium]
MILKSKIFWILFILAAGLLFRLTEEALRIQKEPVQSWIKDVTADCAVVLTGGPGRVRTGFDLLSQKKIKKLIISGVYEGATLRDLLAVWPLYGTMQESDIILEKRSGTTYGNAQQSLPIVEALGCRDIILVTSHTHIYRAYQTFRSAFPTNIEIIKYSIVAGRYRPDWTEVLVEANKSLFYSLWAY